MLVREKNLRFAFINHHLNLICVLHILMTTTWRYLDITPTANFLTEQLMINNDEIKSFDLLMASKRRLLPL
jgi:hypothetical protein